MMLVVCASHSSERHIPQIKLQTSSVPRDVQMHESVSLSYVINQKIFDILNQNNIQSIMTLIRLVGYLESREHNSFALFGDNATTWGQLGSEYWRRGVCKHVNTDKSECTIKTSRETTFTSRVDQECDARDLDGCYVTVTAMIKKYSFFTLPGAKVSGWQIVAKHIAQSSPITIRQ
jgi:hypothetical protein